MATKKIKEYKNIMDALFEVIDDAEDSALKPTYFRRHKAAFDYLQQRINLTPFQSLIIAVLIENSEAMCWKQLADFFCMKRIKLMSYNDQITDLLQKKWIRNTTVTYRGSTFQAFGLTYGVIAALGQNISFVPKSLKVDTEQDMALAITKHISKSNACHISQFMNDPEWIHDFIHQNQHLPFCSQMSKYTDYQAGIMMIIFNDYFQFANTPARIGVVYDMIQAAMRDVDLEFDDSVSLTDGSHILIKDGWIEYKCENGIAYNETYVLTRKSIDELFSAVKPKEKVETQKKHDRDLISCEDIQEKPLFYNSEQQKQMDELATLLTTEKLSQVQSRLEEKGRRKGVAILLYGGPGTGKTEFVMQLCKQTGRHCFHVDLSTIKSKWVGESEENIRGIFRRYRRICENTTPQPVLLFNEADGIFNKRNNSPASSVDKMENTMQNIILEEMESLDGILIATSNLLQDTIDPAMERRFLYKIEVQNPDAEVRTKIWQSMLPELTTADASHLARKYEFSGGEIENIARKFDIDYILTGAYPSLTKLEEYCDSESLNRKTTRKTIIGFAA